MGRPSVSNKVASYFGPLTLAVESQVDRNRIVAHLECGGKRLPRTVRFVCRIPKGAKP